ncbi:MAG: ABC transporter substrate-binding protein [Candidatus Gracilibacteria bacterium]|nr:ABC transporter substrate-binding protein [Candidatus Gracilibacteria bacterium]
MNKNKIIFAILGILLLIGIIFIATKLNDNSKNNAKKSDGVFNIWMIGDDTETAKKVVDHFKQIHPEYSSQDITVESFGSYDDYYYSLSSAIIQGKAPDLFVLNNNEKNPIFSNQVIGIDPNTINPNDFRKKYKLLFSDDLIITSGEGEQSQEYLTGLPVGYETLGIFFNRRYIKEADLSSISSLNNVISNIKQSNSNIIPIGIGNGSTVHDSSDIMTQFFMLETDVSGLKDIDSNKMKQSLSAYLQYGDEQGDNGYNSKYADLSSNGKNNVDLFSEGDVYMVVGYPSLIKQIKDKGYSKNFLLATAFPHYFSGQGKTLVNYNYFVINKDSSKQSLANSFLEYLSSDIGAGEYLKNFPYYLPALLSLESDKLKEKIDEGYNIILDDFYDDSYEMSSFDKGVKSIYDKNIIPILDNPVNYEKAFEKFKESIMCKSKKIETLEDLSESCDK